MYGTHRQEDHRFQSGLHERPDKGDGNNGNRIRQGVRIVIDSYALFLFFDCMPLSLCQVSQRRPLLVVLDDVIIENVAVMASHFQGRVSHDLLKGKRIAAAIDQIFTSKGVPLRYNYDKPGKP